MPARNVRAKNEKYRRAGELIALRRAELGLTQEALAAQLARRIKKDVTRQRLQNWEKGVAMPRPAEMEAVATELGLTVDEITRGARAQGVRDAAPQHQESLELTPNAQTIARIWDDLPQAGKDYIAEQLAAMLRFQAEDRDRRPTSLRHRPTPR